MATVTTKSVKRSAAKKSAKENNSAAVIVFNPKHAATKAAIDFGVDHGTSSKAKGLVEQFRRAIIACQQGGMKPGHADVLVDAIRSGIAAKRKAAKINTDFEVATWASRASEAAAVLKLHDYKCVVPLFKTLAEIDVLTFEGLVSIARWMRGPHGNKGAWASDLKTAPSLDDLVGVIAEKRTRASKSNGKKKGGFKKGAGVVGMPSDPVRGLGHVVKCFKAFSKKHGGMIPAQRKSLTQIESTLAAMFKPLKAAVALAEKATADKAVDGK